MVKACTTESPVSKETKLPSDLEPDLHFHANTPAPVIRQFWGRQAARSESLSHAEDQTQAERGALIPPEISHAAKGIRTAPLATLAETQGMGGRKWLRQFIFGFPIVVPLAQRGFPRYPKRRYPHPFPRRVFAPTRHRGSLNVLAAQILATPPPL